MNERIPGTRAVAQRMVNADRRFVENVMDRGFSHAEALRIFGEYKKLRVIKLDAVNGVWTVKHGGFWDADVLQRALAQSRDAKTRRRRR